MATPALPATVSPRSAPGCELPSRLGGSRARSGGKEQGAISRIPGRGEDQHGDVAAPGYVRQHHEELLSSSCRDGSR